MKLGLGLGLSKYSSSAFSPTQLSGCVLWLRADKGTTIGTGIATWADQSGQGNNATQGTGSAQPTLNVSDASYNNQSTVSFASASSQRMTFTSLFPNQPFTAYIVGESSSGAGQQEFFGDTGTDVTVYWTGAAWAIYDSGGFAESSNTTRTAQAFAGVFDHPGAGLLSLYINSSASPTASSGAGGGEPTGVEWLGSDGSSYALNGKIAEMIVYNTAHSSTQVGKLFAYFASRYGKAWS
jgi:hypothetical protein